MLVIAGATVYGICNVTQERLLRSSTIQDQRLPQCLQKSNQVPQESLQLRLFLLVSPIFLGVNSSQPLAVCCLQVDKIQYQAIRYVHTFVSQGHNMTIRINTLCFCYQRNPLSACNINKHRQRLHQFGLLNYKFVNERRKLLQVNTSSQYIADEIAEIADQDLVENQEVIEPEIVDQDIGEDEEGEGEDAGQVQGEEGSGGGDDLPEEDIEPDMLYPAVRSHKWELLNLLWASKDRNLMRLASDLRDNPDFPRDILVQGITGIPQYVRPNSLYVCLPNVSQFSDLDGHNWIPEAVLRGASAILSSRSIYPPEVPENVPVSLVCFYVCIFCVYDQEFENTQRCFKSVYRVRNMTKVNTQYGWSDMMCAYNWCE
eukprot:TRINITY_DN30980_c0_g1_i8.p1 TRINITY_DN30980_c0_g1~~TRINITY_DN30980_c0_g1_i8.p1  ORF type:complete len:372 (+),score=18.85 TRINITY_DN30980_c0_g1_i8:2-1117(+)